MSELKLIYFFSYLKQFRKYAISLLTHPVKVLSFFNILICLQCEYSSLLPYGSKVPMSIFLMVFFSLILHQFTFLLCCTHCSQMFSVGYRIRWCRFKHIELSMFISFLGCMVNKNQQFSHFEKYYIVRKLIQHQKKYTILYVQEVLYKMDLLDIQQSQR